ncbi:universal stress protein [Halobacteriales archaeon Cl-PHB]
MFDRILFPTDGSEGAETVFDHVLDLAEAHDATVYVLNVADTTRDSLSQIQGEVVDVLEREGAQIVDDAADRARRRNVDVRTDVVQGRPHEAILDNAIDRDVDLVVMPTQGRRGLERLLLGSTTERVLRRSDVPVLTVRPDDAAVAHPYENVLVPTDGSDCAGAALSVGTDLATSEGAGLHLLSVVDVASLGADVRSDIQLDSLEKSAESILDSAEATATEAGVASVERTLEYGTSVHEAILNYVEDNDVDVVVVGTHGRTGFDRYLLGSVAESLLRTSPVPVLTVRESDR